MHQDDYLNPKDERPCNPPRPRSPSDENIATGRMRSGGRVRTADRDCLEAVDWVRSRDDVEGSLQDEGGEGEPQGERRGINLAHLAGRTEGSRGKHAHRKVAATPPRHSQYGDQRSDTGRATCADTGGRGGADHDPSQAWEAETPGAGCHKARRQLRGRVGVASPTSGCLLGIVEGPPPARDPPDRQPPGSQVGGENRGGAGHGGLSMRHGTDGPGGRQSRASTDQHAMGLRRKALRRMKSPLRAPKEPHQGQQHPSEDAREAGCIPSDGDGPGRSKTSSWALRDLLRRVRGYLSRGRDPDQRQQHPGESGASSQGTINSRQPATSTSRSDSPGQPPAGEEGEEGGGEDVGSSELLQPTGSEPDDQAARPGGVQDGRGRCDKSACRSCKGKGVEGRGEQSPCRAARAPPPPP